MKRSLLLLLAGGCAVISIAFSSFPAEPSLSDESKDIVIEYDASPVDPSNPVADLAPTEMLLTFRENRSRTDLKAGMGLLETSYISDPAAQQNTLMLKLLNKHYVHVYDQEEISSELDSLPALIIKKTGETKVIADRRCWKANVTFKDNKQEGFAVYYTNELKIADPNWGTPYAEIDGVLMEYRLFHRSFSLNIKARKVKFKKPSNDSLMLVPAQYKQMTSEDLNQIFAALK